MPRDLFEPLEFVDHELLEIGSWLAMMRIGVFVRVETDVSTEVNFAGGQLLSAGILNHQFAVHEVIGLAAAEIQHPSHFAVR